MQAEAAEVRIPQPPAARASERKAGFYRQSWFWILTGLSLGVGAGLLLNVGILPAAGAVLAGKTVSLGAAWGDLFLSILRYAAGPLVFTAIVSAVAGHEDPGELKSLSWKVLAYFVFTSTVATLLGLGVASILRPGLMFAGSAAAGAAVSTAALPTLKGFLLGLIPTDPLTPFLKANTLQVVLMGVVVAAAIALLKSSKNVRAKAIAAAAARWASVGQGWVMKGMQLLMLGAPVAAFGLLGRLFAQSGLGSLLGLGAYVGTVVLGLALLMVFYLLMIRLATGHGPLWFLTRSREALLTGFSTASSAASMPVSLRTAIHELGVRPSLANLLITLGAAVNQEGTALYQAVATLFLAQAFGVPLPLTALLYVLGVLVASSLGTPGAPGAGMAVLATVLAGVGVPLQGIALILGVDRILDMCRTTLNVAGDLTSAVVMDAVGQRSKK